MTVSAVIHLLLIASTLIAAGVAWIIVGLSLATIVSVTAAIVGVLLYIRPLDLLGNPVAVSHRIGGHDVG